MVLELQEFYRFGFTLGFIFFFCCLYSVFVINLFVKSVSLHLYV